MNARLLSLLTFVGFAGLAGTVVVYKASEGVTKAQLVDAGLLDDCKPANVACPARAQLEDGGWSKPKMLARRGAWCADAGAVVLPDLDGGEWFRVDACRRITDSGLLAEGAEYEHPFECACRGSTQCRVRWPDGGIADAPAGVTVGDGYPHQLPALRSNWDNGCIPKSCAEVDRGESWPAQCPL